jgi:hypothetical protein
MRSDDRRLVRLARFLMRAYHRRQLWPRGSRERAIAELVEDEAEAELRKEAHRLDAVNAEVSTPIDPTTSGQDTAN